MELKRISPQQIDLAIQNGEFSPEIIGSDRVVAIIMSQDWCHQWASMEYWLQGLKPIEGLTVYQVLYNLEPYFEPFMAMKETVFQNDLVPYVRYYQNGQFKTASNAVSEGVFLQLLGLSKEK